MHSRASTFDTCNKSKFSQIKGAPNITSITRRYLTLPYRTDTLLFHLFSKPRSSVCNRPNSTNTGPRVSSVSRNSCIAPFIFSVALGFCVFSSDLIEVGGQRPRHLSPCHTDHPEVTPPVLNAHHCHHTALGAPFTIHHPESALPSVSVAHSLSPIDAIQSTNISPLSHKPWPAAHQDGAQRYFGLELNVMDAQNAVGPASTKPAASLKRPGSDPDQHHRSSITHKSPEATIKSSTSKESRSNPPVNRDDAGQDGNSDAETIVLPGRDGLHSPSKVRKIKNEDGEAGDRADYSTQRRHLTNSKHDRDIERKDRDRERGDRVDKSAAASSTNGPNEGKRKKLLDRPDKPRSKDGSSGLSSAPASPPPQRRRRLSKAQSDTDSELARGIPSLKPATSDKAFVSDKLVSHKRKASKVESDDENENRKVRRPRISGSGLSASRSNRDSKPPAKVHNDGHAAPRNRSISPPARPHRRSISTQLPAQSANGLSQKKKRIPAPLQSTEYQSDESSAGGSPHPRSSKFRSLTTPATAESAMSPAKMAPHKKHLDAHGQTFLARACARGEYDVAKTRLQERPEDINVADFAGNTPLQIAALNGFEDIVQLLIDAGCSIDCLNHDKDTPLLDAVDNGHLGVVKLLLAAGVNPRKPNAYGEEPLDRVTDETDNAAEIRQALTEAKRRMGERRRTSEEHHLQDRTDSRSSHGPESSRRSPGVGHGGPSSRRAGTVRSEKTSNHLLYMPMDDRTLRAAAAKGDEETVTRILQVRESFDDPESMVAAARGGHEMVMNLLLALGGANPDPRPLDANNEYSTPMLAAIGQENIKVVRLLLDQSNFDPTGTFKGETYYEIARRRKGPNWIEEEEMLKKAYDEYRKTHKDSSKTKSPSKRDQDQRNRTESKEGVSKSHKRKASSPTREPKKVNSAKPSATSSPKEKRRANSFSVNRDDHTSPKRAPARPKKDDRIPTIAVSDHEGSPAPPKQAMKAKRTESEMAASSEGEAMKPRRKLVSGRELKGEREKQHRRASLTSNASSLKEPQSPHDLKRDEPAEKQQKSEKYHDRTKALKRDESRDRLSVSGENSAKRHRASATPPHHGSSDKDGSEAPPKRRRLDVDGKEKRQKLSSSPDDRPHKPASNREAQGSSVPSSKQGQKTREDGERKHSTKTKKSDSTTEAGHKEPAKPKISDKSIHVKAEDPDVQMRDIDAPAEEPQIRAHQEKAKEDGRPRSTKQEAFNLIQEARKKADLILEARKKADERDRKRQEEEAEKERRRKEEEELKRRAEEETRRHEEEEQRKGKEEEERKAKEEKEKRRQEEEAEQRRQREVEEVRKREEAERKKREEEERKLREEEERKVREEEERKKRIEEAKRRKEEEERRKLEEEERLRREQLEREQAEQARRKREEEERRLREEAERKQREEMERRRAAREAERLAELRRIQLEQERLRLSKLPPLLRWLDGSPNPKLGEVARKFIPMQGVRYDCIRPEATGTADGREQWLLNTQVALLLGEKDLTLSRCKLFTMATIGMSA